MNENFSIDNFYQKIKHAEYPTIKRSLDILNCLMQNNKNYQTTENFLKEYVLNAEESRKKQKYFAKNFAEYYNIKPGDKKPKYLFLLDEK